MSDILAANQIWVVKRRESTWVVAPGRTGLPVSVEPQPLLQRAAYISPTDATRDLRDHADALNERAHLMLKTASPEGPPSQQCILFIHDAEQEIPCLIQGHAVQQASAVRYLAAMPGTSYSWENDFIQGRRGYFLIGSPRTANLWRIARREVDQANRLNFTLVPIELSIGLPVVDFTRLHDPLLRKNAEQHWTDFRNALSAHAPYGAVTAARSIIETVLYDFLLVGGHIKRTSHSLDQLLRRLLALVQNAKSEQPSVPFTVLDYHLMQKIRLLHGGTHADSAAKRGLISPELALTVATDLLAVLTSAGMANSDLIY